jgi:hypothetical protein
MAAPGGQTLEAEVRKLFERYERLFNRALDGPRRSRSLAYPTIIDPEAPPTRRRRRIVWTSTPHDAVRLTEVCRSRTNEEFMGSTLAPTRTITQRH